MGSTSLLRCVSLVCILSVAACGVGSPDPRVAPEGPVNTSNTPASPAASSPSPSGAQSPVEPSGPSGPGTPEASGPSGPSGPSGCDTRQVTPVSLCEDDFTYPSETADWRHPVRTRITTAQGSARHRGIDAVVNDTSPQRLIGKFAYGTFDDDLKDETVEVWIQPVASCEWRKLATLVTSNEDSGTVIWGVEDTGGRVFYEIPKDKQLPTGTYRVKMLVLGDHSSANFSLHVWPRGTSFSVTDMDGTMTTEEADGLWTAFDPLSPDMRPFANDLMNAFAAKNIRPIFLTARPEWMTNGTRQWLYEQGYAFGPLRLSESTLGVSGEEAIAYKGAVVQALVAEGFQFVNGIGNRWTDYEAYVSAGLPPERVWLYDEGDIGAPTPGAVLHQDYGQFLSPLLCEAPR